MIRLILWPVWWLTTALVIAGGFFWGWIPAHLDWFHSIGPREQVESAGGYCATAVILIAAATHLEAIDGPRNAKRLAVGFAAFYTFLALRAGIVLAHAPITFHDLWTGAERAVLMPWALFYLVAGMFGWVAIRRGNAFERRRASSIG